MKKTAFKPEAFKSLEAYSQEFASGKLYISSSARRGIEHCQKQPLWVLVFGVHMRKNSRACLFRNWPKMVFIHLLRFEDSFGFRACPCLLLQAALSRDMRAELEPFLTILGTRMRAAKATQPILLDRLLQQLINPACWLSFSIVRWRRSRTFFLKWIGKC